MTDETTPEDPVSSVEPIDADFEPAPEEESGWRRPAGDGPGWTGTLVMSAISAAVGGMIGLAGARFMPPDIVPGSPELAERLEELARLQDTAGVQIAKLGRDQTELETSLRSEMREVVSGDGNGESLKALVAELDAVSRRLDEAMADGGGEAVSSLTERVEALEAVDTSGEASTQDIARAVAGLETRLSQMEDAIASVRQTASAADVQRLSQLEASIVSLRSELENVKLSGNQDTEQLTSLINSMRAGEAEARGAAEAASRNAEIALALSGIESASRKGSGFDPEYRTLRSILPRDQDVQKLAPIAEAGAPTPEMLRTSFAAASTAAKKALEGDGATGWTWLNRAFGDAVSVRRIDGEDEDPVARLTRAEEALAAGDTGAAVAHVGKLEGEAAAAMADWTRQANRRITLDAAIESLRQRLIEGGP